MKPKSPEFDSPEAIRAQLVIEQKRKTLAVGLIVAGLVAFAVGDLALQIPEAAQFMHDTVAGRFVSMLFPAIPISAGMVLYEVQRPRIARLEGRLVGLLSASRKTATLQDHIQVP